MRRRATEGAVMNTLQPPLLPGQVLLPNGSHKGRPGWTAPALALLLSVIAMSRRATSMEVIVSAILQPRDAGSIQLDAPVRVPSETPDYQAASCTICHWGRTILCDDFSTAAS